ncbi:MAG TPA: hypothetical protein VLK82_12060 [Candidatus Tectomicrobia bacterium]|nr:hypothetical protein [Candidatus Tectomicrobia bacterium]
MIIRESWSSRLGFVLATVGSAVGLGNYPQAFSHMGLISSGINLARLSHGGAT